MSEGSVFLDVSDDEKLPIWKRPKDDDEEEDGDDDVEDVDDDVEDLPAVKEKVKDTTTEAVRRRELFTRFLERKKEQEKAEKKRLKRLREEEYGKEIAYDPTENVVNPNPWANPVEPIYMQSEKQRKTKVLTRPVETLQEKPQLKKPKKKTEKKRERRETAKPVRERPKPVREVIYLSDVDLIPLGLMEMETQILEEAEGAEAFEAPEAMDIMEMETQILKEAEEEEEVEEEPEVAMATNFPVWFDAVLKEAAKFSRREAEHERVYSLSLSLSGSGEEPLKEARKEERNQVISRRAKEIYARLVLHPDRMVEQFASTRSAGPDARTIEEILQGKEK